MSSAINEVHAWEALDSRGRPTVGCRIGVQGGGTGRVIVPSGASTGGHEARESRDGGDRYSGFGVAGAVATVNTAIRAALMGLDVCGQRDIDDRLEQLDGTADLSGLGSNAVLAASLAAMTAAADHHRIPLWQYISDGTLPLIPMPMVNIISGGAHAGRSIDIQDVLVIPVGATSFAEAIEWASRVREASSQLLQQSGHATSLIADEGGLSANFSSNEEALDLVSRAIERTGLACETDVSIAVDIAANQLTEAGRIVLTSESRTLSVDDWIDLIYQWTRRYPIASLEDVLSEDDWSGWSLATATLATQQIVGDDLFATNSTRLQHGIDIGVANSVLVKVNQAGTVTRARTALELAHSNGYTTIVSARSGDTEDHWLADIAVGWRAGQIKVGSTMRSERTAKWNRLLEIESSVPTQFAGRAR